VYLLRFKHLLARPAANMATQTVDSATQRKFENLRAKLAAMHYYQVSAAAPRRSAAVPSDSS